MAELMQPNIVGNFLQAYSAAQDQKRQQEDALYNRQRQMRADQMAEQEFQWKMDDRQLAQSRERASIFARVAQVSDTPEKWAANVPRVMQQYGIEGPMPDFSTREQKMAEVLELKDLLDLEFKKRDAARSDKIAAANIAQSNAAAAASNRANRPAPAGAPQATPALPPLRPLSAREQDAVLKNDETVNNAKSALVSIDEALRLSPKAAAGFGTETLAPIINSFEERARSLGLTTATRASDTVQFNAIVKENILPQLKLIFGGNPTEGERDILLSIAGSSSMGYEARQKLLERIRNAVQRRLSNAESTSNALRNQTYFLPQQYQQPNAQTLQQAQPAPAAASAPPPAPAPMSTVPPPPPGAKVIP